MNICEHNYYRYMYYQILVSLGLSIKLDLMLGTHKVLINLGESSEIERMRYKMHRNSHFSIGIK